jgi:hypothetical protein
MCGGGSTSVSVFFFLRVGAAKECVERYDSALALQDSEREKAKGPKNY